MSSRRGGRRPNAGRKPGVSRTRAQLLTEAFQPDDWLEILRHLKKLALSSGPDSLRAASLLLHYQFGDSSVPVDRALGEDERRAAILARLGQHDDETALSAKSDRATHPAAADQSAERIEELFKKVISNAPPLKNLLATGHF